MKDAGATVIALSYDEPDALAAFAKGNGITFPLLSDPNSEVIRSFGILNTLIAEDDHPWYGIPFPGVYVTDSDGVITDKFFESHLALRPGSDQLIRAVRGEDIQAELGEGTAEPVESVTCQVEVDGAATAPGTLREVHVRLQVPPGQHLYGGPVPDGMVATSVEFDEASGVIVLDTLAPPTRPLTLAGTGETLNVWDGDVTLRVPITYSGALTGKQIGAGFQTLKITGRVRWQACDDEVCGLPQTQDFELALPLTEINRPSRGGGGSEDGSGSEGDGMDTRSLLKAMVDRRD